MRFPNQNVLCLEVGINFHLIWVWLVALLLAFGLHTAGLLCYHVEKLFSTIRVLFFIYMVFKWQLSCYAVWECNNFSFFIMYCGLILRRWKMLWFKKESDFMTSWRKFHFWGPSPVIPISFCARWHVEWMQRNWRYWNLNWFCKFIWLKHLS